MSIDDTNMGATESIFISYRRADTEGYAGRLDDSLTAYFGTGRIFRDVGDIHPGEDFVQRIQHGVAGASAVIVLIGPDWLASDGGAQPRLHDPGDHVAAEIAAALEGPGVTIPVLVKNASMPREQELPDQLKKLSRKNAISLSNENWSADVTRLARVLAMDVSESVTERRLRLVQYLALSLFGATLLFGLLWLAWRSDVAKPADNIVFTLAMIPLIAGGIILAAGAKRFHPSRRRWVWLSVGAAFVGGVLTVLLHTGLGPPSFKDNGELALTHLCATLALTITLVSLSSFKASDWME